LIAGGEKMATEQMISRLPENETGSQPTPHRRWIPWVLMLALAVIAVLGWQAAARRQQEAQNMLAQQARAAALRAVPVSVATIAQRDFPVYLTGLGSVTAFNTVTIQTRVDGQIMKVYFREGDHVKAGQLLMQIDPRPYEIQLDSAQGMLARDQSLLHDAVINLDRDKALWGGGIIPRQQYDTQQATVGQLEGSVQADKSQIANAKLNLEYCNITAPIAGKAGLLAVDPGNIVHAASGAGIVVITQMQPIDVIFTLPQEQLAPVLTGLRQGRSFQVLAFDRADQHQIASGRLEATDNRIDQTTGTLRLKAMFANRDEALFPNQFVNIHILIQVMPHAVLAPAAAIQHGTNGSYVFLVHPDQTVEQRVVQVQLTQGNDVVIAKGLARGDIVVTDGQDKLRTGSRVLTKTASRLAREGEGPQP
jgi:multidrug efflux system membrane fusion protein